MFKFDLQSLAVGHYSAYDNSNGHRNYNSLTEVFSLLIKEAEAMFGPRDASFTPVGIEYGIGSPSITFSPHNHSHVMIVLTNQSKLNLYSAFPELAHEVAHLLGPVPSQKALYLEEGMATYFSEEMCKKYQMSPAPLTGNYTKALSLYHDLIKIDSNAVKKLRGMNYDFFNLTSSQLRTVIPNCGQALANDLCTVF